MALFINRGKPVFYALLWTQRLWFTLCKVNFIYATFQYIRPICWFRIKPFSLGNILRTDCFWLFRYYVSVVIVRLQSCHRSRTLCCYCLVFFSSAIKQVRFSFFLFNFSQANQRQTVKLNGVTVRYLTELHFGVFRFVSPIFSECLRNKRLENVR